jgi:hypothetical protein
MIKTGSVGIPRLLCSSKVNGRFRSPGAEKSACLIGLDTGFSGLFDEVIVRPLAL